METKAPLVDDNEREGRIRGDFTGMVRKQDAWNRAIPRIGRALLPRDEKVRFRQVAHLIFAPSTVAGLTDAEDGVRDMLVYFMGLLGPGGPLPTVYTDVILAKAGGTPHPDLPASSGSESIYRRDPSPAAFIDQFNHRFISFFYRAAVSANKAVDFDRPEESGFHDYIGSLFGLGMKSLQNRMPFSDSVSLFFAGHFSCPTRHAEGLCSIVSDTFRIEARIEHNAGHWVDLDEADQTRLGTDACSGGLGAGTVLGSRIWDRMMRFRLVLGPMDLKGYERFRPDSGALRSLHGLLMLYLGHEWSCEVVFVLHKDEVPSLRLGGGSMLGFSSWLKSASFPEHARSYSQILV